MKASHKFHRDVLEVEIQPNTEENDSRLVEHKKRVVERQNEMRKETEEIQKKKRKIEHERQNEQRKERQEDGGASDSDTTDYGKRTTLSPEQRKIVHSAFSNLDPIKDLTSTGLLKFSVIDEVAKKNGELKNVIKDLRKTKGKSQVKCIIQASLKQRTKAVARSALIKEIQGRKQQEGL